MWDQRDSSDSECSELNDKKEIVVKAVVHAEMNSEPIVSTVESNIDKPKMLLIETRREVDEIFSIPDDISWSKIAKNLDFYKIEDKKPKTPDSVGSDSTAQGEDWDDFSSPELPKVDNPSVKLKSQTVSTSIAKQQVNQPDTWKNLMYRRDRFVYTPQQAKRHYRQVAWTGDSASKMMAEQLDDKPSRWLSNKKPRYLDFETVRPEKKMKKKNSYESESDSDEEDLSDTAEKENKDTLNSSSEVSPIDSFDAILSTPTYEKGQKRAVPEFSYRGRNTYSKE